MNKPPKIVAGDLLEQPLEAIINACEYHCLAATVATRRFQGD